MLTDEQRAEIRRRAREPFLHRPQEAALPDETTSSLKPPGYDRDSFSPESRSVDRHDPIGRSPTEADKHQAGMRLEHSECEEPTRETPMSNVEQVPPKRAADSDYQYTPEFQPLRCRQFPKERFSVREAAARAKVSTPTIYNSLKNGKPIGEHRLEFYRDETEIDAARRAGKPVKGRRARNLGNIPDKSSSRPVAVNVLRQRVEKKMELELEAVREKYQKALDALDEVGGLLGEAA